MKPRQLLTLSSASGNSCIVAPFRGAIVTSLKIRGRELLYLDSSTFEDPTKNVRGGIPILFPTPGKLAEDRWERDGLKGEMKQHGFARNAVWAVMSEDADALTLALNSDDATLRQYPWPFAAQLRFELGASSLRIVTRIRNAGDRAMPFALGFHPYFIAADKSRAHIDSRATRAFDNVAGLTKPFTGFDLAKSEVDLHLIDHAAEQMRLELGDATVAVRASSSFRRWIVWTLPGKEFVCVEPWTAPGNALNSGEDLIVLAPGDTHESWIEVGLA